MTTAIEEHLNCLIIYLFQAYFRCYHEFVILLYLFVCPEQPPRIEPRQLFGHSFNINDRAKFNRALSLLRECTDGPMFAADNIITWNKNLSFMRDEYFLEILSSKDADLIEKSIIWRLYILSYFAKSCICLQGDYLELGCYLGGTVERVMESIDFRGSGKKYWLYDLFEWSDGSAHTYMPGHDDPQMYENVVKRFKHKPWVRVVKGSVPDSFSRGFPDKIAFAHIDMNNPAPESGALMKVLPRLSKGGIIVLDDYGWWGYSSQKRVLDPIAADYGLSILELPTGQGLILNR